MKQSLVDFVVDWRPTGQPEGSEALRACLRCVEADVETFECDLPVRDSQPSDARRAWAVLIGAARKPRRSPPATGVLRPGDENVWEAFVIFAPHALDGSVWTVDGDGRPAVHFADEGTAITVRLTDEQRVRLSDRLPDGVALVPLQEWRARRHGRA